MVRARHVLGDEAASAAQGLAPSLGGHVRGLTPASGRTAHVRFGHAPLRPGPLHAFELDP